MAHEVLLHTQQFVSFYLSDSQYGVPVRQVQEIIPMTEITPIPKSSSFIEGVIEKRGKILPIIDLRKHFSIASENAKLENQILIIDFRKKDVGFIVDKVISVVKISRNDIRPAPPVKLSGVDRECLQGIVEMDEKQGNTLILLNLEKAFSLQQAAFLHRLPEKK